MLELLDLVVLSLNPLQGETVLDLGCGAGFDVFLAATAIGAAGKAIGVDMNEVTCFDLKICKCLA